MAMEASLECDFYHVLGLSHLGMGATQEEVREAYLELAKAHHPDKGGRKEDFQAINRAYSVLGDAKARGGYDRARYLRTVHASEARGSGIPMEPQPEWVLSRMRGRKAALNLGRFLCVGGLITASFVPFQVLFQLTHVFTVVQYCGCCKLVLGQAAQSVLFHVPVVSQALQVWLGVSAGIGLGWTIEQLATNPRQFHHFLKGAAAGLAEGAWDAVDAITDFFPNKHWLKLLAKTGGPLVNHLLPGAKCVRENLAIGEASKPRYVYFCRTCREWLCSHCAYYCHEDHRVGLAVSTGEIGEQGCCCGVKECADRHREPVASLITGSADIGIEDGEWLQVDYAQESAKRPRIDQDYVMIGDRSQPENSGKEGI